MDEFGEQKAQNLPEEQERQQMSLMIDDRRPIHPTRSPSRSRPSSPAPFAHYSPKDDPLVAVEKHKHGGDLLQKADDGDDGTGCCKCVIM